MRYDPHRDHRRSNRLPTYDYGEAGAYFVTIRTQRGDCILDNAAFRALLARVWSSIVGTSVDPEDGEFIVMPNHMHGVVLLDGGAPGARHRTASRERQDRGDKYRRPESIVVPHASPLRTFAAPTPGSLGAVIASFKSLTARCINRARNTPGAPVWQRNYYEHIIRNEADLLRIREYIRGNPAEWADDAENPANHRTNP